MLEGYKRYGLLENPFPDRRPLDPLSNSQDYNLLARVAGFRILDDIDAALKENVDNNRSSFFLIAGGDGTGRTSVANYILGRYRDLRAIKQDHFIIPDRNYMNHSKVDVYRNWLLNLTNEIEDRDFDIGDLSEKLSETAQTIKPELIETVWGLIGRVSRALDKLEPKAGFGLCLEQIPQLDIFEAALKIFQRAMTVCIITASDTLLSTETSQTVRDHSHKLNPIKGEDVKEVVERRWTGAPPNPFDADGLVKAFDEPLPIGRVIFIMGKVLDSKLSYFPKGESWPQAKELEFDPELIVSQVGIHRPDWRSLHD